jgi:hypothetical protein
VDEWAVRGRFQATLETAILETATLETAILETVAAPSIPVGSKVKRGF